MQMELARAIVNQGQHLGLNNSMAEWLHQTISDQTSAAQKSPTTESLCFRRGISLGRQPGPPAAGPLEHRASVDEGAHCLPSGIVDTCIDHGLESLDLEPPPPSHDYSVAIDPELAFLDWEGQSPRFQLPTCTLPPVKSTMQMDDVQQTPQPKVSTSISRSPSICTHSSTPSLLTTPTLSLSSAPSTDGNSMFTFAPHGAETESPTSYAGGAAAAAVLTAAAANASASTGAGGDSSKNSETSTNPLLTAISMGNLEIARLLIQAGAKLDIADSTGNTPLHRAVKRGDVSTVTSLLEVGADVLKLSGEGSSPLHMAVEAGNEEVVRALLQWCASHENGSNEDKQEQQTEDAQTKALAMALGPCAGSAAGRDLLRRCIDARNGINMTAVHLSVMLQRVDILRILLEHGADVNMGCEA